MSDTFTMDEAQPRLLDEQQFIVIGHGHDHDHAAGVDAFNIFPVVAPFKTQEFAFVEGAIGRHIGVRACEQHRQV